jgi:alginate O-acetyltransferase complex protein AlgI
MLFNSINYFLFLAVVFVIYYLIPDKFRWILLLLASIFFYAIGGAITIVIPVIIIVSTFFSGLLIEKASSDRKKKAVFRTGLIVNLCLLIFFKYINFLISTVIDSINILNHLIQGGKTVDHTSITLQIIIPLGISYITFQAIGYLIEIKRGNQQPEKNFPLFATYLMFFPKLLSGPIERAHNLIPQLHQKHPFDYDLVVGGLKRILWGLFLKLVVANRLAIYTDAVFNNYEQHTGITLLIASIFFTIQLYADFAGYTEMAIGSAQILGYRLMENFNFPFMAKSVTEFWRRWHISLTTWVTDYIYNPIVIQRRNWNKWAVVYAAMVTFLILGFWHGASWNFIIFGFLQGLILSIEYVSRKLRKNIRSKIPNWVNSILGISFTFSFFCFSTIFFKAVSATDAKNIVTKISTFRGSIFYDSPSTLIYSIFCILFLVGFGVKRAYYHGAFSFLNNQSWVIRKLSYTTLIVIILLVGVFDGGQFIYFKF